MKDSKPILLVEDDIVDALTVKKALAEIKVTNALVHKANGEEALKYLNDDYNLKPSLIFLDLNMPKMNGVEFLRLVKASSTLKRIPVIVLTTSKDEQDIIDTFELSVAAYMVKSVDYARFVEMLRAVDLYWTFSEMPPDNQEDAFPAALHTASAQD
jgi:CheY-like chemotaxis protein